MKSVPDPIFRRDLELAGPLAQVVPLYFSCSNGCHVGLLLKAPWQVQVVRYNESLVLRRFIVSN